MKRGRILNYVYFMNSADMCLEILAQQPVQNSIPKCFQTCIHFHETSCFRFG